MCGGRAAAGPALRRAVHAVVEELEVAISIHAYLEEPAWLLEGYEAFD